MACKGPPIAQAEAALQRTVQLNNNKLRQSRHQTLQRGNNQTRRACLEATDKIQIQIQIHHGRQADLLPDRILHLNPPKTYVSLKGTSHKTFIHLSVAVRPSDFSGCPTILTTNFTFAARC